MKRSIKKVKRKINRTRRRYYLIYFSNSVIKFLFLFFGLLLAFFALTPFLFEQKGYKQVFLSVAIITAAFGFTRYFILPMFRGKKKSYFALLLEKASPGINNQVINAVQLASLTPEEVQKYGYSEKLIAMTIDDAAKKAAQLSPKKAVSSKTMLKNLRTTALLTLLIVATFLYQPNFFKDTFSKFIFPEKFSKKGSAEIVEELKKAGLDLPEVGDFKIAYKYPLYTHRVDGEVIGSSGGITCLKGTQVTVTAKSDRPLDGVAVVLNDNQKITAKVRNGTEIEFSFIALEVGTYHIEFSGIDYPEDFEHKLFKIEIEEDEYPVIKLLEPKEDFTVEENDELKVVYESSDDFGISKINLVIEGEDSSKVLSVYSNQGKLMGVSAEAVYVTDKHSPDPKLSQDIAEIVLSGTFSYDLSLVTLTPGELLKVYLEVYDNDMISGPKKSVSNERYLDVYSKDKRKREIEEMKERLFEMFISLLGDHFEKSFVKVDMSSVTEVTINQSDMGERASDVIALLNELITAMEEEEIQDDISYIPFRNMRLNLQDIFSNKEKKLKSMSDEKYDTAQLLEDVKDLLVLKSIEILEAEKNIIYLDNERKKAVMDQVVEDAEELVDAQKSLLELLEELKEKGDMTDSKEKLQEMMKKMEEMMKKISEKMSKFPQSMPDEFTNQDAMKELDTDESKSLMEQLKESIENDDIDKALELAEELLNSMNEMAQTFESSAQEFEQNESQDIMAELDKAIEKLEELEKKQDDLMKETKELTKNAKQRKMEDDKGKVADFLRKQQKLISEIRNEMNSVRQELLKNPPTKEQLAKNEQTNFHGERNIPPLMQDKDYKQTQDIMKKLRELPRMLMQDLNQSEAQAKDILEETKKMMENFEKEDFGERMKTPGSGENAKKRGENAKKKEEELVKNFKEFKEGLEKFMTDEEKKQLQEMAGQQGDLQSDLEQLKKGMEKAGGESPFMNNKESTGAMEKAGKSMGGSKESMKAGSSPGSVPHQREAISQMNGAKNSLQQMKGMLQQMQGQSPGQNPGGKPGRKPGMGMGQGSGQGQPDRNRDHNSQGRGLNVDDVAIPGAEEFSSPKQYREELLKAMKKKSPKEYKNKVKKYYEELIR